MLTRSERSASRTSSPRPAAPETRTRSDSSSETRKPATLRVPGSADEFVPSRRTFSASSTQSASAADSKGGPTARRQLDIARTAEGEYARDMINRQPKKGDPHKLSDRLLSTTHEPQYLHFRNCANFVSAVLEAGGTLPTNKKSVNVAELVGNLRELSNAKRAGQPGWTQVQAAANPNETQFREGDVVAIVNPSGTGNHVMMFSHYDKDGSPMFIGSHNLPVDEPGMVGEQMVHTKAYDLSKYSPDRIAIFRYSDS